MGGTMEAQLSVVIACYNGAGTLGRQLSALAHQTCSVPFEVIVADNGSVDGSVRLAQSYRGELDIRVVDASARRGPAHARNVGVAASTGRFLAFCDADDVVADNWLEESVRCLAAAPFVAGRVDIHRLNDAHVAGYRDFEQEHGLQTSHTALDLPHAGAGNMAIVREAFLAVDGFDENLHCLEDTDLCYRVQLAGYPLSFAPSMLVHVSVRDSGRRAFGQGYGYGVGQAALEARYGRARRPAAASSRPRGIWRSTADRLRRPAVLQSNLWRAGFRLGHWAGGRGAHERALASVASAKARYPNHQPTGDGRVIAY